MDPAVVTTLAIAIPGVCALLGIVVTARAAGQQTAAEGTVAWLRAEITVLRTENQRLLGLLYAAGVNPHSHT